MTHPKLMVVIHGFRMTSSMTDRKWSCEECRQSLGVVLRERALTLLIEIGKLNSSSKSLTETIHNIQRVRGDKTLEIMQKNKNIQR